MFKLNLKIALRNLFKNKVYAIINIGGLALGLTALVLLLLYINHEESYDTWNGDLKNVYKVREHHDFYTPDNKEHWQYKNESRVASLLKNKIPQILYTTKVSEIYSDGYAVKLPGADPLLVKDFRDADTAFFKVFPYTFVYGDQQTALDKPNTAVLKQSAAIQLFGTDRVLGKTFKLVRWTGDEGTPMTVTGVIEDPKGPESLSINAITHTGENDTDPEHLSNSTLRLVYARIPPGANLDHINKLIQPAYIAYKETVFAARGTTYEEHIKKGYKPGLKLMPIEEVHANPDFTASWLIKLKPVIAIALFLFLISIINFINLATAQSVQRAKEVGVKKVLGSYKAQLMVQFLIESAIQSLAALFACIILVELFLPAFNFQFGVLLSFWHNPALPFILLQLIGVFIVVTLLAGLYPAWILSNYNPVAVLKGNYENSLKGVFLRNALVVFQFGISVTFIIAIGIMHAQTTFLSNKDLGFDRNRLLNISTTYDDKFAGIVRRVPGVTHVATSTQVMGNAFNVPEEIMYKGTAYKMNTVSVTMD
ncbi:MAG: FtsX-like permease family protein, partial [Pedobacter sp.]